MPTKKRNSDRDLSPRKRRRLCSDGNPAPAMISKLVDDLLVEILIRLPHPRSAFLCKAVCKRWNSLISDPSSSFTRRFISHRRSSNHPPPPSLFLPSNDPQAILCFLPVPDGARPNPRVFDCFKDLISWSRLMALLPNWTERTLSAIRSRSNGSPFL
ncbi:unnamed protein product [Linum tenue]|uniref:F-box domain-containing protein n=1 Tax=Linum tenue TaxID=586396 RepID=A0AAV0JSL7_9ROSI|nr:unnamed protein product [Linum tenue]